MLTNISKCCIKELCSRGKLHICTVKSAEEVSGMATPHWKPVLSYSSEMNAWWHCVCFRAPWLIMNGSAFGGSCILHSMKLLVERYWLLSDSGWWTIRLSQSLRAASNAPPAAVGILQTRHSSPGGHLHYCVLIRNAYCADSKQCL